MNIMKKIKNKKRIWKKSLQKSFLKKKIMEETFI